MSPSGHESPDIFSSVVQSAWLLPLVDWCDNVQAGYKGPLFRWDECSWFSERWTNRTLSHPGQLHLGYFQYRISAMATDVRRFHPPDLPVMQTRRRAWGHINSPVMLFVVLLLLLNICRKKAFIRSVSVRLYATAYLEEKSLLKLTNINLWMVIIT